MGEGIKAVESTIKERIDIDTFGGKVHVEWDPQSSVSPMQDMAIRG
jgi:hypothetical protein